MKRRLFGAENEFSISQQRYPEGSLIFCVWDIRGRVGARELDTWSCLVALFLMAITRIMLAVAANHYSRSPGGSVIAVVLHETLWQRRWPGLMPFKWVSSPRPRGGPPLPVLRSPFDGSDVFPMNLFAHVHLVT